MTTSRVAISLSLSLCAMLAGVGHAATAPIEEVVVYGDRAQVTRRARFECAAGEAVFDGLPSTLAPRTLAASVAGRGAVRGLAHEEQATGSVFPQRRPRREDPSPRASAADLQRRVAALDDELALGQHEIDAARASERKLLGLLGHLQRTWAVQVTAKTPPIASWDGALDLGRAQALRASQRLLAAEVRRRGLLRERDDLRVDLGRIEAARRRTIYRVRVFLACSGRAEVQLSYVVPGATWRVAYQARADESKGEVELVAQAVVQQGSGEDWSNVRLLVSTASLERNNLPPRPRPMSVAARRPQEVRKELARRFEAHEPLRAAGGDDRDRKKSTGRGGYLGPRAEAAHEPGLAASIVAAARATVPADGRAVIVTLDRRTLRAAATLETVPKLYLFVYRKLALANPFPFPMLAGPVAVYRGPAYVGSARVPLRAAREPFELSLGVEPQLRVERFVKAERLEGAGALGSTQRLRNRYLIEVGNWTRAPQRVRVVENIPVSRERALRVSLDPDATPPSSTREAEGHLAWELTLPPRSKRAVTLAYSVALPASWHVSGY